MLSTLGSQQRLNFFSSSSGKLTSPTNRNPNPRIPAFLRPNPTTPSPPLFSRFRLTLNTTRITFSATAPSSSSSSSSSSASPQVISALDSPVPAPAADDDLSPPDSEKLGVLVKLIERPRIVLKFIWMERNIGLALDQVIPGHGSIPLSPYYFWPRKDAWEELKIMLENKPWISQKQVVVLLNHATDIINLWQQNLSDSS